MRILLRPSHDAVDIDVNKVMFTLFIDSFNQNIVRLSHAMTAITRDHANIVGCSHDIDEELL
jgi:hypothetical protein